MVVFVSLILLLIPERFNKVFFITVGCFVLSAGAFLTGPSRLFHLPNKVGVIRTGLIVSGIGRAFAQSYSVSYIVRSG